MAFGTPNSGSDQTWASTRCGNLSTMHALKARVENGRYVIDEPAQLPEGAEVELVIVAGDDLDERGRAALHASLDRALDDEDSGRFVDTEKFLAEVDAGT